MNEAPLHGRVVLVCTAERPPGTKPSCGAAGIALLLELRERIESLRPGDEIRVIPTGCLGACEHRAVVADVRGDGTLYVDVSPEDMDELARRLVSLTEEDTWDTTL